MTHIFLQHYWWFVVSLLAALLVFMFFVQGGQSLIFSFAWNGRGKSDEQGVRSRHTDKDGVSLIEILGSKWEITFTTLVTFGGAFFASFPLFYSTSFGGAYWAWILLLLCFVLQAVSYEFQKRKGNLLGSSAYRIFLMINGILAPILLGVVVGTFFTGAPFSVDKGGLLNASQPVISHWDSVWHGLEALWSSSLNLLMGAVVFFLTRVLALLYIIHSGTGESGVGEHLHKRLRLRLWTNSILFVFHFLLMLGKLLTRNGYAVNPETQQVFLEPYKYLHNFLQMPVVSAILLMGVVFVLFGILRTLLSRGSEYKNGIWFAGIGSVLAVLALLLCAGWNNTAYYPSTSNLQSSLTIVNSSSSYFTLKTMFYVSLLIPFVIAYIGYTWKALSRKETRK